MTPVEPNQDIVMKTPANTLIFVGKRPEVRSGGGPESAGRLRERLQGDNEVAEGRPAVCCGQLGGRRV